MVDVLTGSAFDAPRRMHHREDEVALEFPSSASSRRRNLVGLKCQNWRASGGAPGPLPDGYTKLEYIRNTEERGAWATLPLVLNTDRIEFRVQNEAAALSGYGYSYFYGWNRRAGYVWNLGVGMAIIRPDSSTFRSCVLRIGEAYDDDRGTMDFGALDDLSFEIDFASRTVTLNGQPYMRAKYNFDRPFEGGSSVYRPRIGYCIFANLAESEYATSTYYLTGMGKYFGYRQTRDGVDICNLVPCRRDSDMVHGFYDLVSNTFVRSESGVDWVA